MFLLRKPSPELLDRVLSTQRREPLSYGHPGITRSAEAAGYPRTIHEAWLGSGPESFHRAVAAVKAWAMYDLPWTEIHPAETPVRVDATFATLVHHLGFWSINPCRVVYAEEAATPSRRTFAFAIGTLPMHSERGEERFLVEWDLERDLVRFEIRAYAGAQHWMARLGTPYVRLLQRRFGREAVEAVSRRV